MITALVFAACALLALMIAAWRWLPARRERTDTATEPVDADAFQDYVLPRVSRSFALTIPLLPPELRRAVGNAYLLCRIADTIEDDAALAFDDKRAYERRLIAVVRGTEPAGPLAAALYPRLAPETPAAERDLMRRLPDVVAVYASLRPAARTAIARCVEIMGEGMQRYQRDAGPEGLASLTEMDRYCYHVAGVVGEMLTELFCDHDPAIAAQAPMLRRLAVSFGEGLQMTNILKDQWEDRSRGVCWLPRDLFARHGVMPAQLAAGTPGSGYRAAQAELVGLTHAHLQNALAFSLTIPASEPGIRRFCLWAIGLALLTLRNLQRQPDFRDASQLKVSRLGLITTILLVNLATRSDRLLRLVFRLYGLGLPVARLAAVDDGPIRFASQAPGRP